MNKVSYKQLNEITAQMSLALGYSISMYPVLDDKFKIKRGVCGIKITMPSGMQESDWGAKPHHVHVKQLFLCLSMNCRGINDNLGKALAINEAKYSNTNVLRNFM